MKNNKKSLFQSPVSYILAGLILFFGGIAVFAIYSANGFSRLGGWLKKFPRKRSGRVADDEE